MKEEQTKNNNELLSNLRNKKENISIVGLGYVGLPLAIEFAKKFNVVGFDVNKNKLEKYLDGIDVTNEVGDEAVKNTTIEFTNDESEIKDCKVHIVAVPTPINIDKTPDLTPVIGASKTVGRNLTKGSIVIYESTVYPGTTEEICIPILEEESGLKFGVDFKIGYSPERINPGDKVNTLTKIVKIVSGSDDETLEVIANIYEEIIEVGVHRAESIRVAEAAKVIENSQRDINIAFMNELSMVFNKMNIDTKAVLEAAGTKWNFLNFTPGLVGGHCIGVDPYYFIYKAEQLGYHSQIILSGRKINDGMGKHVVDNTIKKMIKAEQAVKGSNVGVLGITFKEDCPDVRNTRVIDIIRELEDYGVNVLVHDPVADVAEVYNEYGIKLVDKEELSNLECIILAVPHEKFKKEYSIDDLDAMYGNGEKVIVDIKHTLSKKEYQQRDYHYWSL